MRAQRRPGLQARFAKDILCQEYGFARLTHRPASRCFNRVRIELGQDFIGIVVEQDQFSPHGQGHFQVDHLAVLNDRHGLACRIHQCDRHIFDDRVEIVLHARNKVRYAARGRWNLCILNEIRIRHIGANPVRIRRYPRIGAGALLPSAPDTPADNADLVGTTILVVFHQWTATVALTGILAALLQPGADERLIHDQRLVIRRIAFQHGGLAKTRLTHRCCHGWGRSFLQDEARRSECEIARILPFGALAWLQFHQITKPGHPSLLTRLGQSVRRRICRQGRKWSLPWRVEFHERDVCTLVDIFGARISRVRDNLRNECSL